LQNDNRRVKLDSRISLPRRSGGTSLWMWRRTHGIVGGSGDSDSQREELTHAKVGGQPSHNV